MTLSRSVRRRLAAPVTAAVAALGLVAGCATTVTGAPAAAGPAVSVGASPDPSTVATDDTEQAPPTDTVTDRTVAPSDGNGAYDTTTDEPPVDGESVDPAEFAAQVQEGMSGISSMTFVLTTKATGQSLKISGAQTVEDGTVTAAQMKIGGAMALEFRLVGGKVYLGGDASVMKALGVDDPDTEWVVAEKGSSNTALATIAEQLEASLDQSGPGSFVALAKSLKSVTLTGEKTVDGVTGTGYVVVIDVDAFAGTSAVNKQSAAAMKAAGLDEVEMTMQLDDKNRIQQITQEFEISGQQVSNEFVVSDYDTPVTIEAPDPATVADGN